MAIAKTNIDMSENKNNPLEEFQKILEQQHINATKNLNNTLYNEILKTAKVLENNKDEKMVKEIVNNLREQFKNEDLNQITDIFIYCQSFLSSNENPLPKPSQLCISVGKLFTTENLDYTASKVYDKDQLISGCALSFLGYLALHEHHTSYVLTFIKENFEGFSQNKKTECVFQLKEVLPDNQIVKEIIQNSGITRYELVFSTEADSTSKPITFKTGNFETSPEADNIEPDSKAPWWKFWSRK